MKKRIEQLPDAKLKAEPAGCNGAVKRPNQGNLLFRQFGRRKVHRVQIGIEVVLVNGVRGRAIQK